MLQKKWLYVFVFTACIAGLAWTFANLNGNLHDPSRLQGVGVDVCLFHRVTGLPCPSCGSTHAVLFIMQLRFADAWHANPLGFILVFGMFVFPFWIAYDVLRHSGSFFRFYQAAENAIRTKWVAAALILLVTANWIWNIYKFTA